MVSYPASLESQPKACHLARVLSESDLWPVEVWRQEELVKRYLGGKEMKESEFLDWSRRQRRAMMKNLWEDEKGVS